jgi:hypothetical protein
MAVSIDGEVVAWIAAVASVAAALWSSREAKQAKRSADAAEATLEIERERRADERRAKEDAEAPRFELLLGGSNYGAWVRRDEAEITVRNARGVRGVIESAHFRHGDRDVEAQPPSPRMVDVDHDESLHFVGVDFAFLLQAQTERPRLVMTYGTGDGPRWQMTIPFRRQQSDSDSLLYVGGQPRVVRLTSAS